jgi:hypothetical protein
MENEWEKHKLILIWNNYDKQIELEYDRIEALSKEVNQVLLKGKVVCEYNKNLVTLVINR